MNLDAFVNLPWPQLASFMGFLVASCAFLGILSVRVRILRKWLGLNLHQWLGNVLSGALTEQTNELRNEMHDNSSSGTRAIHDLTIVMATNHEEAMGKINDTAERLHNHETNPKLHGGTE